MSFTLEINGAALCGKTNQGTRDERIHLGEGVGISDKICAFDDDTENTIDSSEDNSLPAFQATPLSHGIRRIKTTDANRQQRDLIDKFIQGSPQIARGKSGDYPTGNIAKDSLEEDFSIVTETMAVLFAKQGKLDKARKAFRKLMEQHPEKSIYFAAQLKNLEHFKK